MTTEASYDEKVCSRCKELKSLNDFYLDSKNKDGRKYICKACCNQLRGNSPAGDPELRRIAAGRKISATKTQNTIRDYGLAVAEILLHSEIRGY